METSLSLLLKQLLSSYCSNFLLPTAQTSFLSLKKNLSCHFFLSPSFSRPKIFIPSKLSLASSLPSVAAWAQGNNLQKSPEKSYSPLPENISHGSRQDHPPTAMENPSPLAYSLKILSQVSGSPFLSKNLPPLSSTILLYSPHGKPPQNQSHPQNISNGLSKSKNLHYPLSCSFSSPSPLSPKVTKQKLLSATRKHITLSHYLTLSPSLKISLSKVSLSSVSLSQNISLSKYLFLRFLFLASQPEKPPL